MKKLITIPLLIVMAGMLVLGGCATAEEDSGKDLLITINTPVEWGGGARVGNYYTPLLFIKGAVASGEFSSITVYLGPEASDLAAAEGGWDAIGAPMFPEGENLHDVARAYTNDLGVKFIVPKGPIEHHGTVVADYIVLVDDAALAAIVAEADISLAY